ncbi:MAG: NAD(+)/NADH kinase [Cyanobacteria bacterium SIG28]|nr:NAD(+)/NADH kinase [Cyanobacteria bacterium SIG28]
MKFNVVYNQQIENYNDVLSGIENSLIEKDIEFKTFELDKKENYGDISLVIGGDGTILNALRFYSQWQTPVMGINVGRLGFLSQSYKGTFTELIEAILEKRFYTEERMMLTAKNSLAVNDFVIKGCNSSRTTKFHLEINNTEVCDYIADGLIVSTPTGSTAYGLSAGGPVLYPTMDAISIVPICPHTLNARPLVVPKNEIITIKTDDKLLSVFVDGSELKECVEKINIKSSPNKAIIAFLRDERFYSVLRNKLHWGISPTSV